MNKDLTLPNIDYNNRTNNMNYNTSNRDQSQDNNTHMNNNLMKSNISYNPSVSKSIYNPASKEASTMKQKLYILEEYVSSLHQEMEIHKKSVDRLNEGQIASHLRTKKQFNDISGEVYNELQKVEDFSEEEFKKQDSENVKLQGEINQEKKDSSKLSKHYLELMNRLSILYTHVGLENTHLDLSKY